MIMMRVFLGAMLGFLLGQAGGPVRPPLLQLTDSEKDVIREAFAGCGLKT